MPPNSGRPCVPLSNERLCILKDFYLSNGRFVPLNCGGFAPPKSGRIVSLHPLEDAFPSIMGSTVPPSPPWEGHVHLNSGMFCPVPFGGLIGFP